MPVLEEGVILSNQRVAEALWEMEIMAPQIAAQAKPGQFVQVKVGDLLDPLLRRPLSLYDVDKTKGTLTFLYKIVGKGTELLSFRKAQENIELVGPLGHGFTLPAQPLRALLVGGGVGIAPLLFLARELQACDCKVTVVYGVGHQGQLAGLDRFRQLGIECLLATVDGSAGLKGFVTDLFDCEICIEEIDYIYTCGPEVMMGAVAKYAAKHSISGEVSLEENMACGVGACLGCARKLKNDDVNYVKVCQDGPVFDMQAVEFKND